MSGPNEAYASMACLSIKLSVLDTLTSLKLGSRTCTSQGSPFNPSLQKRQLVISTLSQGNSQASFCFTSGVVSEWLPSIARAHFHEWLPSRLRDSEGLAKRQPISWLGGWTFLNSWFAYSLATIGAKYKPRLCWL